MHEALALAEYAQDQNEVPVGAVIVLNNKVIGKGWNQPISKNDPSAHAEVIAIRDAAKEVNNYRLLDATLYVTLEPCLMCVGAILHARIKKLVFGAFDPKTGAVSSLFNMLTDSRHNHHVEVRGGILEAECAKLLQTFFKQRR